MEKKMPNKTEDLLAWERFASAALTGLLAAKDPNPTAKAAHFAHEMMTFRSEREESQKKKSTPML